MKPHPFLSSRLNDQVTGVTLILIKSKFFNIVINNLCGSDMAFFIFVKGAFIIGEF